MSSVRWLTTSWKTSGCDHLEASMKADAGLSMRLLVSSRMVRARRRKAIAMIGSIKAIAEEATVAASFMQLRRKAVEEARRAARKEEADRPAAVEKKDEAAKEKEKVPSLKTETEVPQGDPLLQAKGKAKANAKLPIPRFVEGLPLDRKTKAYATSTPAAIARKAKTANIIIQRFASFTRRRMDVRKETLARTCISKGEPLPLAKAKPRRKPRKEHEC